MNSKGAVVVVAAPILLVLGIVMSLIMFLGAGATSVEDCSDDSHGGGVQKSYNKSGSAAGAAPVSNDAAENVKNYLPELQEASRVSGFPVSLIAATIQQESGWNPKIVSPSGAQGVGQFMPGTWPSYGQGDPFNPHDAIPAMGRYIKDIRRIMRENNVPGDEIDIVLRSYNAGPYSVIARSGGAASSNGHSGDENADYAPMIRGYWPQYQQIVKDLGVEENSSVGEADTSIRESHQQDSEKKSSDQKQDQQAQGKECQKKDGSGSGADAHDGSVSGNDDYPWRDMPHCDGNEQNCPDQPDPTHSYPSECTAFAAWRVIQQTGGDENNITFFSPGSASTWQGHWDSKGWGSGKKPVVGAVVWYAPGQAGASSFGHVAVVKEVYEDGTFMEEGYNGLAAPNDHKYYTRKTANDAPSAFLYIPKQGK